MSGALQDAGDLTRLLARAARDGIITVEQAEAIGALARSPAVEIPHDDERLRFITGFADIFVTIGLAMFLGAATWFAWNALPAALAMAVLAALSWLLAEVFTRRRRMALPSIALLASFVGGCAAGIEAALRGHLFGAGTPSSSVVGLSGDPAAVCLAALGAAGLAALHYRRFWVPVTIAAEAAAVVAAALAVFEAVLPGVLARHFDILLACCGLLVFALAMRFDLSDRQRATRASDIAFWLHLLAAPLIVHPLLGLLGGRDPSLSAAGPILGAFVLLAGVALLIDRRALLVSGLLYAGLALGRFMRETGLIGQSIPLTLLLLGAFVLALSAGWHLLRRALLRLLPPPVAAHLPLPMESR